MFTSHSYEMTRALVAEHQQTLRHEARQHRSVRRNRRTRRGGLGSGATPRPRLAGASLSQPLLG
ncbi:MAG: hypothetical protein ACJ739_17735 [Acidimicrobiales bacterium]